MTIRPLTAAAMLCSLMISLGTPFTAEAASPAVPAAEWTTLNQGKVVVKDQAAKQKNTPPSVEAKILIPKPPEKVWTVVSNPKLLMQKEAKVKQIKVLSQSGNTQDLEYTVMMTKLLPTFNYTLRHVSYPPNTVQFQRLSGSFKDFKGSWKLTPVENGQKTILTYQLSLDPGPMVPTFMLMPAVKADLPNMMKNVKAVIEK